MATIELPELGGKEFWRNARLLLWSFIVAMAALQWAGLVKVPEYFGGMLTLTYIVAGWIVSYNLLKKWRT